MQKENKIDSSRKMLVKYLKIFGGVFLLAFSINMMFEPVSLVTGGFSGFAIVIKSLTAVGEKTGLPVWVTTTALNIPLFALAFKIYGYKYLRRNLLCSVLFSVFMSIMPKLDFLGGDLLLISVFGGVITGISRGLLFSVESTTGGTDLAASLLRQVFKQYTVTELVQVLDGMIILFGIWVFGIKMALYAVIAIAVSSGVAGWMLEGMKISKLTYIISDKSEIIAERILIEVDRGVTRINAVGGYSGENKEMLVCVTSKKELVKLKDIAISTDKAAFVIVCNVGEVFGRGFIENS